MHHSSDFIMMGVGNLSEIPGFSDALLIELNDNPDPVRDDFMWKNHCNVCLDHTVVFEIGTCRHTVCKSCLVSLLRLESPMRCPNCRRSQPPLPRSFITSMAKYITDEGVPSPPPGVDAKWIPVGIYSLWIGLDMTTVEKFPPWYQRSQQPVRHAGHFDALSAEWDSYDFMNL